MPRPSTREEAEKLIGKRTELPIPSHSKSEYRRLQEQQVQQEPKKRSDIGSIFSTPVMNPRAIVNERLDQAENGMKKGGVVRNKKNTVKRRK